MFVYNSSAAPLSLAASDAVGHSPLVSMCHSNDSSKPNVTVSALHQRCIMLSCESSDSLSAPLATCSLSSALTSSPSITSSWFASAASPLVSAVQTRCLRQHHGAKHGALYCQHEHLRQAAVVSAAEHRVATVFCEKGVLQSLPRLTLAGPVDVVGLVCCNAM